MALPVGRTLFKKKDGILTLTPDQQTVTWTPNSGGPPTVSLPVASITNLQQTPDSSPKVMLKIFEKPAGGGDPVTFLFHFHTSEAKAEAQAVKDLLSRLLADLRSNDPSIPKPTSSSAGPGTPASAQNGSKPPPPPPQQQQQTANGGSASGSMAFASAVNSSSTSQPARWFDDVSLRTDIELQQSLMRKDQALHQTYMEAIATKPSNISDAAFNGQFWSTRLGLLRAHAIEASQRRGAYNVLSVVKPRTVDGELKVSISVEQVHMIFAQHPLVKRIYNENVPRLSEADFWSRFLQSRLCKALRGERVTESDHRDALFDKYDAADNTMGVQSKIMAQSVVPHIIDIEGNEENQGGVRSGNAKDVEMRPRANIPIVKTLNSLSGKIMANVAPSDSLVVDPGSDQQHYAYDQLALRDLRGPEKEHRIMLNVKEQSRFFSNRSAAPSANARVFAKQNPADVLFDIQGDLETLDVDTAGGIDLHAGIGYNEDSEDDSDGESKKQHAHVGSRSVLRAAEREILAGVAQQRSQKFSDPASSSTDSSSPMGLPPALAAKCSLTHATTIEFLHQFWSAFLSGDPDRAMELQYLAESLAKSRERIEAVAEEAAAARDEEIKRKKQEIWAVYEKTRKKIRWKPEQVGGGRDAVMKLMGPTLDAMKQARDDYDRALLAEGIKVSTEV